MKKMLTFGIIGITLLVLVGWGAAKSNPPAHAGRLQIIAAENFWGSLAQQLGGDQVQVTSVVSDPNADPHEYETNTNTARAFAKANYVVLNGAGYDTWGNKLVVANPVAGRKTLTVATLLGKKDGDNPHFWYNPAYVNRVVVQMDRDLIALDPSHEAYFETQLKTVQTKLEVYQSQVAALQKQYAGTPVAATEDIFAYLSDAAGLNLISPPAFIQAVAEGNDPPANSIATFQQQLTQSQPRVLVYNEQTVTPLTESIKKQAAEQRIPVVGITETMQPPNSTFEDWMDSQITRLGQALQGVH